MDQLLHLDDHTGKRTHTDLLSGSFTLHCMSRNGLEADHLAQLVCDFVRIYRRQLQKAGFFQIGNDVNIGVEGSAAGYFQGDSVSDYVSVPVSFPCFYQSSWTSEPKAVLLAGISAQVAAISVRFDGSPTVPGSVDKNGLPVVGALGVIVQSWRVGE